MSPDPFDEIDRALASGLSALAPEVGGADDALASLQPKFRRARTRARAVKVGGALAVVFAIGSVVALAAPASQRTHVQVSSTPTTPEPVGNHPRPSTTTVPPTTVPVTTPTTTPTTRTHPIGAGAASSGNGATPTTAPASAPTTPNTVGNPNPGGSGSGNGQGGGGSPGTTIPGSHGELRVYRSPGGGVRVRFSNGALSLVSVSPARGYRADVRRNEPGIVEVRFSNDHGTWRLRVFPDHGRVVREVDHT